MRRRHFLAALGGAAVSWPCAALAQKALPRIGFLADGAAASINSAYQIRTIKQGLADNGLIEGRDYIFEPRFAAASNERLSEALRDLSGIGVSVILAEAVASVRAAQRLVPPLPVVMIAVDDPVGNGLIAGLASPGGRTTGIATANIEIASKMLGLQRSVLPKAASTAILHSPTNPGFLDSIRTRAGGLGIAVTPIAFQSRDELEAAFRKLAQKPPDAVQIMLDAQTSDLMDRIPVLALMHRLPAFANTPEFAGFGGLIGYGPSREHIYLRSGYFVKKILDGASPAALPVEPPSRIELWINQNTASALNVSMPASLLASADKIMG
ncbi:MAG TPA: ABC transporter substrate-binding protein [Bradyrhizobium sp.]|uniref:ABC transporter substrate-binding protein n=1 Tax=Bradyrhizobium sp. TaxID=376 RepID=UPI002B668D62|nr:ABC transporter substrate-binding protein [Bradyrhizobium sp.]HLZ02019.1 ABC transporter substrate-binding protein [Bradyrhizobium sp.]